MAVIIRTDALLTSSLSSDPWLASMWWLPGTTGGSTADATDCLDRFRDMWVLLAAKVATGVSIANQGTVIAVEATTGALTGAFSGVAGAAVSSSGGSAPLPAQTQGMIRWATAGVVNNRRVRGRTFVPLPDEGDNDTSGKPGSSYTSQLALGVAALLTAGTTASEPVVWHRPVNNAGGSQHFITGGGARTTWAVLRSRR